MNFYSQRTLKKMFEPHHQYGFQRKQWDDWIKSIVHGIYRKYLSRHIKNHNAPSIFSFLKLFCAILTYLIILKYDNTLSKNIPPIIFLINALLCILLMIFNQFEKKATISLCLTSPHRNFINKSCKYFTRIFLFFSFLQIFQLNIKYLFIAFIIFSLFLCYEACLLYFKKNQNAKQNIFNDKIACTIYIIVNTLAALIKIIILLVRHLLQIIKQKKLSAMNLIQYVLIDIWKQKQSQSIIVEQLSPQSTQIFLLPAYNAFIFVIILIIVQRHLERQKIFTNIGQFFGVITIFFIQIIWWIYNGIQQNFALFFLSFGLITTFLYYKIYLCYLTKFQKKLSYFQFELLPSILSTILLIYSTIQPNNILKCNLIFNIVYIVIFLYFIYLSLKNYQKKG